MDDKPRPAHEIRLGRIRVTIWSRNSGSGSIEYYSVACRLYKDANNRWAQASGYWPEDLPVVAKVLDMAALWIWKQKSKAFAFRAED